MTRGHHAHSWMVIICDHVYKQARDHPYHRQGAGCFGELRLKSASTFLLYVRPHPFRSCKLGSVWLQSKNYCPHHLEPWTKWMTFLLHRQFWLKLPLLIALNPSDWINTNRNLPSPEPWSLQAFTSLCRWTDTFFSYMKTEAVRGDVHTQPEDLWDSQDLCIGCHCLHPSCHPCQLLQFPCQWVFFSNSGRACAIARLLSADHPKLFSFRVFHHGMKEGDLLIYVLHTEIFKSNCLDDPMEQLETTY